MSKIEKFARTIGSGNLEEPVPAIKGGEIGTLAQTLEAMRLSLKESTALRMQSYESLLASEERFRRIIDTAEEGIWIVDREWKTTYVNSRLERMLGYKAAEMLGRHVGEFMDDEGRRDAQEKMVRRERLLRDTHELRLIRKDGTELWAIVSSNPVESATGQIDGALSMLTDITDRREAQEALRRQEEYYRSLFENAMDIITLIAPDGTILFESPSVERIVGFKPEELVGLNGFNLIHPEDVEPTREIFERLIRNPGKTEHGEFRFRHKNGSWRMLDAVGSNLLHVPAIGAIVLNERDVTERHRAEERLRISLREKEILFREIHHRVKNNLQVISSLLDLQAGASENPEIIKVLRISGQRVKTMAMIHQKLYDRGDPARIMVNDYVEDLVHAIVEANRPDGSVAVQCDVPAISLSINEAVPCGLILNELLSNCLEHAFAKGQKGNIKITIRPSRERTLSLLVEDDGVGLPEGVDIDKPASLGLTIVRTLVAQLGGMMEIQRGAGTRFHIVFSHKS